MSLGLGACQAYNGMAMECCVTPLSLKLSGLPDDWCDDEMSTYHRSFVRHISFVSVLSLRQSCRRSNTRRSNRRRWHNVGLLLADRRRRWANISPLLGYLVVFDATLNGGQRHRQRANINPASSSSYFTARARARPISIGLKVWRTNKRRQPDILAT